MMISKKREQHQVLRDMMAALAVCNNVTPVDKGQVAEVHGSEEVNVMELGDNLNRQSFN